MAKATGDVTATVSHLQSLMKNARKDSDMNPNVHDRLSITPTNFLLLMSTHSTTAERNYGVIPLCPTLVVSPS